MILVQYD